MQKIITGKKLCVLDYLVFALAISICVQLLSDVSVVMDQFRFESP